MKHPPPQTTTIKGAVCQLTLFEVKERDVFGRPSLLKLCPDDEQMPLRDNMEFTLLWVPRKMLAKSPREL